MNTQILLGLFIPFAGTVLGSGMVFFLGKEMKSQLQKLLLGFASGVMIAASVWSLLIPAIDMAEEQGKVGWIAPAIGFLLGMLFLLVLDSIIPHMHLDKEKPEGVKAKLKKTTMLVLAVTLHNIPEGMAVGVVFAGMMVGNTSITMAGALALAIDLLDDYDHRTLKKIDGNIDERKIEYSECIKIINKLRFNEGSSLFAIERDRGLESIIGNIYQSFDGKDVYKSIEEKGANFLYLIVKNHVFADGNKRIAATLFIYFLNFYGISKRKRSTYRFSYEFFKH